MQKTTAASNEATDTTPLPPDWIELPIYYNTVTGTCQGGIQGEIRGGMPRRRSGEIRAVGGDVEPGGGEGLAGGDQ